MKKWLPILYSLINALIEAYVRAARKRRAPAGRPRVPGSFGGADSPLAAAIEKRLCGVQVQAGGRVVKLLPDDNEGSRHQRFLLRLAEGQSLLIAHNVDVGRRVEPLQAGDRVEFVGEYEWNEQGGVVHWTHRDPGGWHAHGWVKHNGSIYQR